jgi:hypothetical protein
MKYLKMFNESNEVLYREIDKNELLSLIDSHKPCDLEKRWESKLFEWFKSNNISFNRRLMTKLSCFNGGGDVDFNGVEGLSCVTNKYINGVFAEVCFITQLDDDWFILLGCFYLSGKPKIFSYYECDQYEGLIQLMGSFK